MTTHTNGRNVRTATPVMPNFLVIGAQKCGTTALYHYLSQHPDVFMSPVKEPNFFAFEGQRVTFYDADGRISPITKNSIIDLASYQALFGERKGEKAVGEASPHYLYLPGTAQRIKQHIPEVRLIAILRNPIDRAYSAYLHARRANREPIEDFDEALRCESDRIRTKHGYIYHYTQAGFYFAQLLEYYNVFDAQQIKVYLYDDFEDNATDIIRNIYNFLGINHSFCPDVSRRHNKSGLPKNAMLHNLYQYIGTRQGLYRYIPNYIKTLLPTSTIRDIASRLKSDNLYKPPMPPTSYMYLRSLFADDIKQLELLLKRDLSIWLKY